MREPYLILWELEFVIKWQRVVIIDAFTVPIIILKESVIIEILSKFFVLVSRDRILEIFYIITVSLPPIFSRKWVSDKIRIFLHEFLKAENDRFHSCFVQAVSFG